MADGKGRYWDGKSRVSTQQYKDNYDSIFGKKRKTQNERTNGTRPRRSNKRK